MLAGPEGVYFVPNCYATCQAREETGRHTRSVPATSDRHAPHCWWQQPLPHGPLPEQSVLLVEEQDRVICLGRNECASKILLGLPDVLANNFVQVYPM